MTQLELTDNLTYISARQMLAQLVGKGSLTEDEATAVNKELRRRLRPYNDCRPITHFI